MTCTRGGCNNVQCYICHKSCDYSHFNDRNRGGKAGNCPLFDESIEQRHENEVREAEKKTRQQILEAGANFDEELLDVKVSYKVKEDDARRKEQVGNAVQPAGGVRCKLRADPSRQLSFLPYETTLAEAKQRELTKT